MQIEPATLERFHEVFQLPLYQSNRPLEPIPFHARPPQTRPDRLGRHTDIPPAVRGWQFGKPGMGAE